MKLGIIGAMEIEVESLVAKLQDRVITEKAGSAFYEGTLNGMKAVVVRCGVGKVNAALCVQILCDCFDVTHVINTGIAGSLNVDLDIGDLVVSRDVIHHDFDCRIFGYAMGQVPGMGVAAFPADEKLASVAFGAAQTVHPEHVRKGRIASGDQFISSPEQKRKIIADTDAVCAEMEGAAIAQAAYRNGIPFVIIRAISDKADDSAQMDYPTFEAIAAKRCAKVTETLAEMLLRDN